MSATHGMQITSAQKLLRSISDGPLRFRSAPRIYFAVKDESVWANLVNRRERPHRVYRTLLTPETLATVGLPADVTMRWSQNAGCSMCPCSPGFIVTDKRFANVPCPFDIWFTVEGEQHEPVNEAYIAHAIMSAGVVDMDQAR